MPKTVGPVNIKVGVNAQGAFAEIGKLENRLRRSQGMMSRLGKGVAGFAGGFGSSLSKGLPGAGFRFGGAAALGASFATSIFSSLTEAMGRAFSTGKLAERFQISTEAMVGLQFAAERAGVGSETLTTGLNKLRQNLGEAALGNTQQIETLAQLGLTYQELQRLPINEQFGVIADRLNKVSDISARAALTVQLFGRGGQEMANLLSRGSAGIAQMSEEARQLGLTFTRDDLDRIKSVRKAWLQLGGITQGMATRLLVDLGPALEETAANLSNLIGLFGDLARLLGQLNEMLPTGGGSRLGQQPRGFLEDLTVQRAVTGALTVGISEVWRAIEALRAATQTMQVPPGAAIGGLQGALHPTGSIVQAITKLNADIIRGFDSLKTSLEDELASLQGMSRLDITLNHLRDALARQLPQLPLANIPGGTGPVGSGIASAWNTFVNAVSGPAAAKSTAMLREQFRIQVEIAQNLDRQITALRNRHALERQAAQIITATQSPLEQFSQRMGEIAQLTNRGLLSGNVGTLATAGAFRQLVDALPQASATGPEALQQGSAAAQAAINRFNRQGGQVSIPEQIRNVLRQTQQIEQQQLNEAREVRRVLQNLGVVAPAGLAP